MKKSKLITIIAAVLVVITLFAVLSSCRVKTYSIKSYINSHEKYESSNTVFSKAEEIGELKNASLNHYVSDIFHFVSYENNNYAKHMIYNPISNKVVATYTESAETDFEINLYRNYYIGQSYYTVIKSSYSVNEDGARDSDFPTTQTTELCSRDAEKIASAQSTAGVKNIADMIYFDGKLYGVESSKKDNVKIELLFEYSPLSDLPSSLEKHGKYYYEFNSDSFSVYNNKLELLSNFTLPKFAEEYNYGVLENGNVLIQYLYVADDNADDYSLIYEDGNNLVKFYLKTLIVNYRSGNTKEIKCDYLFDNIDNLNENSNAHFKNPIIAEAFAIENKRPSAECSVFIDNKGNVIRLEDYKGLAISSIVPVAENRWKLTVENGKSYLLDKRGALIGDITNASTSYSDKFLVVKGISDSSSPGKIYDYSLNEIFDASSLTYYQYIGSSIICTNSAGEYLLYSGADSAKTIVAKDSDTRFLETLIHKFYVLYTGTAYELYNSNGEMLISSNYKSYITERPFDVVSNNGSYVLLSANREVFKNGEISYETVYYIIK